MKAAVAMCAAGLLRALLIALGWFNALSLASILTLVGVRLIDM
jgi:hypothetical protein